MACGIFAWIGLLIAVASIATTSADDGLLRRVGSAETKTFYTSLWGHNLNWIEAQEFCNQAQPGMQLATVESERERQVLYTFFVSNWASRIYYEFWLSGTDWGKEGQFSWTRSGDPVEFAVIQDGADGGKQENCLKINYDARFFDESCFGWTSNQTWPLCEIKLNGTIPTTTTSAPPTDPTPAPFECKAEGMFPDPVRCDAYHVCIAHQGSFIDHEFNCPEYTNYCDDRQICGYPLECPCDGEQGLNEFSKTMKNSQVPAGVKPRTEKTAVELVGRVEGKAYYTDSTARNLNWIESAEFCHQNDMTLATMETEAERSFLVSYLSGSFSVDSFWLSAMDYGTEGSYYWTNDGTKLEIPIYGNGGRASNCLYLYKTGPVYDWSCADHQSAKLWPLCQVLEE